MSELARLAGVAMSEAEGLLRRHLGVVFDIGHQSVGFEDIPESLTKLVNAAIPIFKLQEAAALWVKELSLELIPQLRVFTDTIYLSQTTMRQGGVVTKFLNLGGGARRVRERSAPGRDPHPLPRSRVPLRAWAFPDHSICDAGCAQDASARPRCPDHLEIETYTWTCCPSTSRRATSSTT